MCTIALPRTMHFTGVCNLYNLHKLKCVWSDMYPIFRLRYLVNK